MQRIVLLITLIATAFISNAQRGSLDPSFGGTGVVTIPGIGSLPDFANDVKIQDDGKIILCGTRNNLEAFGVARLNPDGTLDNSFGTGGIANFTLLAGTDNVAISLVIEPVTNKIIVAGYVGRASTDVGVIRLNPDGSLDNSFDGDGIKTFNITTSDFLYYVALQSDGKIVLGGTVVYDGAQNGDFAVARLNDDGSLDNSFDDDGIKTMDGGNSRGDFARAVTIQPDDKIVIGGVLFPFPSGQSDFLLFRLNTDGSFDNGFDGDGKLQLDFEIAFSEECFALTMQDDGKIIAAGSISYDGLHIPVARLNSDGSLDNSFDGDGKKVIDLYPGVFSFTVARDLAIQNDGKIVIGGTHSDLSHQDFLAIVLNSDGSFDPDFGLNGIKIIDISGHSEDLFGAVAIQSDGKIVMAGSTSIGQFPYTYDFTALRLLNTAREDEFCGYTILAKNTVGLGDNNNVSTGSVGVLTSTGSATFKKNSSVAGPGAFVKSPIINTQEPVNIPNKIFSSVSISLPAMQNNTSNTSTLPDYTVVSENNLIVLDGNYRNLRIKTGSTVKLNGSVFGNIIIEDGTKVWFSSKSLDIDKITVNYGQNDLATLIYFLDLTSIRIKEQVYIGGNSTINPNASSITFYVGNGISDANKFTINARNTFVNGSIYIPDGDLKVTGGENGACNMSGIFIVRNLEAEAKNIVWNKDNCSGFTAQTINSPVESAITESKVILTDAGSMASVKIFPNPSKDIFSFKFQSDQNQAASLVVSDISGRVLEKKNNILPGSVITFGQTLLPGVYIVQVQAGDYKKTFKLIRQ